MTRFLSHFSEKEIKVIMIIMRKFLKGDCLISVRIADTKFDIDYHKIFEELGYHVVEKNLVYKNKYSRYEYWVLN